MNAAKIEGIDRCWHTIELPDGSCTPGMKALNLLQAEEQAVFSLISVEGKTVLDVGAWDGYFSFAAERRGARRVTASDWHCWVGDGWGSRRVFDFARRALESSVEDWVCKAEELPTNGPKWDVVLLLGVTYHVKNPIEIISRVSNLSRRDVVIETEYRDDGDAEPKLYLIPDDSLNSDHSNWNVPNRAGAIAMCEIAGLRNVRAIHHPTIPDRRIFLHGVV